MSHHRISCEDSACPSGSAAYVQTETWSVFLLKYLRKSPHQNFFSWKLQPYTIAFLQKKKTGLKNIEYSRSCVPNCELHWFFVVLAPIYKGNPFVKFQPKMGWLAMNQTRARINIYWPDFFHWTTPDVNFFFCMFLVSHNAYENS